MDIPRRAVWCLLLVVCLASRTLGWGGEADPLAAALREAGIEPDRAGIEKLLQAARPNPEREAKVRALLVDLGSERFQTREKASAELLKMEHIPTQLLKEAAERDEESRRRVDRILNAAQNVKFTDNLLLTYRFIEAKKIKGLAPLLLEILPHWPEEHLTQTAAKAIEASAERGDGKLLRDELAKSKSVDSRAAAVAALAAVFGAEVEKELAGLLADPSPPVALQAAVALLNQGKRTPLPVLVRLLEAEKADDRQAAANVLRAVTGQFLPFASYDEPKQRTQDVAGWRAWVAKEGETAKLLLPVADRQVMRGRLLVGVYGEKVLREIDLATGKTIFQGGKFTYPWGSHATPEGHRLQVDYQDGLVVEYDSQGKEIWRKNVPGKPTGVQRLPNGRTLVALPEPGMIVELDRAGEVVWKLTFDGSRCTTAQRLPNGNTLITLQEHRKIAEVDRTGKIVWELPGLGRPHTVQPLANGNVLVCDFEQGITEFNRAGKVVWSKKGIDNPAQAQRLPDGNTLISGTEGIMLFDAQGMLVRHFKVGRARFFAY